MDINRQNKITKKACADEISECFSKSLLSWYDENKRDLPWRRTKDPYYIWVSEVMLQQTQVNTVIPYFERFLEHFPTVDILAEASEDEVLNCWRGLGYYSRARHLWEGAKYVTQQFGGYVPGDYNTLLKIPGVGTYTAGAVASIAFGQKVPAIDGNVKRVVSRILAWREPVEKAKSLKQFTSVLERWQPLDKSGDFNQALMELGATVCTPKKPDCKICPVAEYCIACTLDEVQSFPVKIPKKRPKRVTRLTFILKKGEEVYLQQRPPQGMLAGLWEFPGIELDGEWEYCQIENPEWQGISSLTKEEWFAFYQQAVSDRNYDRQVETYIDQIEQKLNPEGPVEYVFSHRRWQIYWLEINLDRSDPAAVRGSNLNEKVSEYKSDHQLKTRVFWAKVENLTQLALPVAFDELVKMLQKAGN